MLEKLQYVCNELKDDNEIAIFRKYGNNAKRYTVIIICKKVFLSIVISSKRNELLQIHSMRI
jgi:hypothetical protein